MLNVVKYPSTSIPFAIAQDDKLLNKKALHLRGFQYYCHTEWSEASCN
jgi:hypothetical protein